MTSSAVSGFVVFVLALAAVVLPVPYLIEMPGPVFNTLGKVEGRSEDVVEVHGKRTYPTTGHLDMLTVGVVGGPGRHINAVRVLTGVADSSNSVAPTEAYYPLTTTRDEVTRQNSAQMTSSQDAATAAALTELGIPFSSELVVAAPAEDGPAAGKVRKGDVLVSVNGHRLDGRAQLKLLHREVARSSEVELVLTRGGQRETVRITPKKIEGTPRIGVLISERFRFPITVRFHLEDVGGPSAGTVFALTIIDKLTEGDLTGGKKIAGTGAITSTGTVEPIGGARQKVAAAARAGNAYFLSPRENCAEAVEAAQEHSIRVVRIDSLHAAKQAVDDIAHDRTAELPSCSAGK